MTVVKVDISRMPVELFLDEEPHRTFGTGKVFDTEMALTVMF